MSNVMNGLYVRRPRTCPCGTVFEAKKPAATYCSNRCRLDFTKYGREYGHYAPKELLVRGKVAGAWTEWKR